MKASIVWLVTSVAATAGIEIVRYRYKKKENGTYPVGKMIAKVLEQAVIILLSAIFALYITNTSEENRIKQQAAGIMRASSNELADVIETVWAGTQYEDKTYLKQMVKDITISKRALDMRDIMFSDSIIIYLEPNMIGNISKFEAYYDVCWQNIRTLIDVPDENRDWDDIYLYTTKLLNYSEMLMGMINTEICYLEGKNYDHTASPFDPKLIPEETHIRYTTAISLLQP